MVNEERARSREAHVYFTTNYSMLRVRAEWEAGRFPAHHLWGALALEQAGFTVSLLPCRENWNRGRIATAVRARLGDVRAEFIALRQKPSGIFYAADAASFGGLALLPPFLRRHAPTVAVIHPAPDRGWLRARSLLRYDVAIAISKVAYEYLLALGRSAEQTVLLPWGPDLEFEGYGGGSDEIVVSSGKTHRDLATLFAALRSSGVPATVHVNRAADRGDFGTVESKVAAPYSEVLADLRRASTVAIPLTGEFGTVGLTELNDALALGKPVLMTRNRYIDVDIEAIGCGFWVEAGDVDGWATALSRLASDPALRADMGARARQFAEERWNAKLFGDGVVQAISRIR